MFDILWGLREWWRKDNVTLQIAQQTAAARKAERDFTMRCIADLQARLHAMHQVAGIEMRHDTVIEKTSQSLTDILAGTYILKDE